MKSSPVWLLVPVVLAPVLRAQVQDDPALTGYVTRVASSSDFDVNGVHVICNGTEYLPPGTVRSNNRPPFACPAQTPYLGEGFKIYGTTDAQGTSVYASRLEAMRASGREIAGSAVIDAIPVQGKVQANELLVRADGYRIRIAGKTKIDWNSPMQSLADVRAGDWISYKGKLDATGTLIADSVHIGPNAIGDQEEKLRAKDEYDPSQVPPDARQNLVKDAFEFGYDPKQFPPFDDPALQARIEKIGNSLIPAYQRALPDSDPAKIHFRFQLVGNKHFCGMMPCDVFSLPSGVILVPHQLAERMQNDSQLAAVLADAIARPLERQQYRTEGKVKLAYASALAAAFVPYGAGLGFAVGNTAIRLIVKEMHQSGRVSLDLLHDAGYDVDQAPLAWWLLASQKAKPIAEIEMPERAGYLYRILGECWHNPAPAL
ncbi:MAG TPA: hypothetical protein VGG45_07195 [Terracidiphilus sp.]|jgi:hypothetical protein